MLFTAIKQPTWQDESRDDTQRNPHCCCRVGLLDTRDFPASFPEAEERAKLCLRSETNWVVRSASLGPPESSPG